jgi:hypothetical protein
MYSSTFRIEANSPEEHASILSGVNRYFNRVSLSPSAIRIFIIALVRLSLSARANLDILDQKIIYRFIVSGAFINHLYQYIMIWKYELE